MRGNCLLLVSQLLSAGQKPAATRDGKSAAPGAQPVFTSLAAVGEAAGAFLGLGLSEQL